ncbi:MAG: phosphate propanoyltransferase [Desulfobacterales bacterium]|nr:phosphate propanoyltransferase [Desulfobacterales bacterium]
MNEKIVEDIINKVMNQLVNEAPTSLVDSKESIAIPVELSARHVHLSEQDAIALFGGPLTHVRELSQPGQFLCKERVRLIGPKGVIDNVAILGPSRDFSQVEISKTDARILGTETPVKHSGDIDGTPGIILASHKGIVGLEKGLIVAGRHIHMTPGEALKMGVSDKDLVSVHIDGDRPAILEDVCVRTNENFRLSMHIDLDEGNGAGWNKNVSGRIVGKHKETSRGLHIH